MSTPSTRSAPPPDSGRGGAGRAVRASCPAGSQPADRRPPVPSALALAGTGWYTQIGAGTPYAALVAALLLVGVGMGATITPAMAAAFQGLPQAVMGQATSAINVIQRVAGAVGSALLAVVLQQSMSARLPGFRGGIGQANTIAAASPHAAAAVAGAFGVSFAVSFGIAVAALIPAVLLPGRPRRRGHDTEQSNS
jgi:MFS family permease